MIFGVFFFEFCFSFFFSSFVFFLSLFLSLSCSLSLSLSPFFLSYHDRVLERGKLHHRVRDLPAPQRRQALVEPAHPLGRDELWHPVGQAAREPGHGLDLDLDGLEGAQADVGEELGRGGPGEEDEGLVLGGVLGADGVGVGPGWEERGGGGKKEKVSRKKKGCRGRGFFRCC